MVAAIRDTKCFSDHEATEGIVSVEVHYGQLGDGARHENMHCLRTPWTEARGRARTAFAAEQGPKGVQACAIRTRDPETGVEDRERQHCV